MWAPLHFQPPVSSHVTLVSLRHRKLLLRQCFLARDNSLKNGIGHVRLRQQLALRTSSLALDQAKAGESDHVIVLIEHEHLPVFSEMQLAYEIGEEVEIEIDRQDPQQSSIFREARVGAGDSRKPSS